MRRIADVNVSAQVVRRLQARGVDIVRVTELLDPRSPDVEIVAHARRLGAAVVTHDQDLTAILAVSRATGPSLINLRTSSVVVEFLAACIEAAIADARQDLLRGAIITVDDGGIRIRLLPIGDP